MKYATATVEFAGNTHTLRLIGAGTLQQAIDGIYEHFDEEYDTNVLMIPLKVVAITYGTCND